MVDPPPTRYENSMLLTAKGSRIHHLSWSLWGYNIMYMKTPRLVHPKNSITYHRTVVVIFIIARRKIWKIICSLHWWQGKQLVFWIMTHYQRMMFSEEVMEHITETPGRMWKHSHRCDQNFKNNILWKVWGKPTSN